MNLLESKAEKEIKRKSLNQWTGHKSCLIRGNVEGVARKGDEKGNDPSF